MTARLVTGLPRFHTADGKFDARALALYSIRVWRLIEALRLLACSADDQIAALPSFVVVADEIALLFEAEFGAVDPAQFAPGVRGQLAAIDRQLSEMSNDATLWTADALRAAEDWAALRLAATDALEALGATAAVPDLSWLTFVGGS